MLPDVIDAISLGFVGISSQSDQSNLSGRTTPLQCAKDAAGDEREAEQCEHDDGADAQLRDGVSRLAILQTTLVTTCLLPGLKFSSFFK